MYKKQLYITQLYNYTMISSVCQGHSTVFSVKTISFFLFDVSGSGRVRCRNPEYDSFKKSGIFLFFDRKKLFFHFKIKAIAESGENRLTKFKNSVMIILSIESGTVSATSSRDTVHLTNDCDKESRLEEQTAAEQTEHTPFEMGYLPPDADGHFFWMLENDT